jgi:hypothetical protein
MKRKTELDKPWDPRIHRCKRFRSTGSLRLFAGHLSISVNGKRTEVTANADRVELTCIRCGQIQWAERANVQSDGKYFVLKAAEDEGAK